MKCKNSQKKCLSDLQVHITLNRNYLDEIWHRILSKATLHSLTITMDSPKNNISPEAITRFIFKVC